MKKTPLHPPDPERAETRSFPSFVLGSQECLNVPQRLRLRFSSRLRPCQSAFLIILNRH